MAKPGYICDDRYHGDVDYGYGYGAALCPVCHESRGRPGIVPKPRDLVDPKDCPHGELTTDVVMATIHCPRCGSSASINDAIELQSLFDAQWKRSREADKLWQAAHPDQGTVWPDLGKLLGWLMDERKRYRDALEAVLGRVIDDAAYETIREALDVRA